MSLLQENKDLQPIDVNDDQPESLMCIESADKFDLLKTLMTYFLLLSFSVIVSIMVPESKSHNKMYCFNVDGEASISFSLSNFQFFNQFLFNDFQIKRTNTTQKQLSNAYFNTNVKSYKSNKLLKKINYSHSIRPVFPTRKSIFSAPQRFYFDDSIDFDKIMYTINFHNLSDNIESITIRTTNGQKTTFIFNLIMRSFFMLFHLVFLAIFYSKLKKEAYWHQEQKLTLALSILCLLFNIPLWMFYQYFRFLDNLFQSLFYSFLKIYVISIFAIVRTPYMNKETTSLLTQIFLFILLFLSDFSHKNMTDISLTNLLSPVSSPAGAIIAFKLGLNMIYSTWLIVSIASTYSKVKGSESFRNSYFTYLLISSLIAYLAALLLVKFRGASKCSADEFVNFLVLNIFVLMMSYLHWPFDTKNEVFYTEMKEESVDLLDSEHSEN